MASQSKVALVFCENYQLENVRQGIRRGLELVGGAGQFAKPDEKILIKANMLVGEDPAKCVGPHPLVFRAVLEEFLKTKSDLSFGDSPGFGSPKAAARQAGLLAVADQLNVPLADFETPVTRSYSDTCLIKQFTFAKSVIESDGLISLSKLKTHGLTRFTGAIKNQFGCIPGMLKAEFHSKLPTVDLFSQMLVDVNLAIKPRLYIMDGIVAMEGNGPRNGSPRPVHVLLFSTDPVALDAVACRIINLDETLVEPINYGNAFGLGSSKDILLAGDPLERFIVPDFQANRAKAGTNSRRESKAGKTLKNLIIPRPVINAEKCKLCERCITVCPANPKALSWTDGKELPPVYNYDRCIRCYCCQELCPHAAISIKVPLLGRLIRR